MVGGLMVSKFDRKLPDIITDEQRQRLARLAAFGQQLSTEGVEQWRWSGSGKRPCNTQEDLPELITLPGFEFTPSAESFHQYCYENGWILKDFAWPAWSKSPAGARLLEDPELIASADVKTLSRLLTVILRSERFTEGAIAGYWFRGTIPAILRRAAELSKAKS
jgi:hypothetical protein